MALDFFLLKEEGGKILLEVGDGSAMLLEKSFGEAGGGTTGGKTKQVGKSVYDLDPSLDRKTKKKRDRAQSKLVLTERARINSKLAFTIKNKAESVIRFRFLERTKGRLIIPALEESQASLKVKQIAKAINRLPQRWYLKIQAERINKAIKNRTKLKKLETIMKLYKEVGTLKPSHHIFYFDFNEVCKEADLTAFTGSSSFVGNVRYDADTQGMRILLNGKAYNFCNVPRRIFDSFQGADSKGAFFNRAIKGQFDC